MNKKGFTLLELLAVIVVLAIIALITIPIITNLTGSSKKKAFEATMYAVEEAATTYYEDAVFEHGEDIFTESEDGSYYLTLDLSSQADLNKLNIKKNFDKGVVIISGNGDINITAIKDNICGEKSSKKEIVNILNMKTDIECYLLEASDDEFESNQIVGEIKGLSQENQDIKESLANLKDNIKNLENASVVDKVYPVGSIYISEDLNTAAKVDSALGGHWVPFGEGKVLRSSTNKSGVTNDSTGTVVLSVDNIPGHTHSFTPTGSVSTPTFTGTSVATGNQSANPGATFTGKNANTGNQSANHTHSGTTASAGAHSHYIRRTCISMKNLGGAAYWGYTVWTSNGNSTESAGAHTHTFSTGNQSANHTHNYTPAGSVSLSGNHTHSITPAGTVSTPTFTGTASNTENTGSGTEFNILDPYVTVYMYKRES